MRYAVCCFLLVVTHANSFGSEVIPLDQIWGPANGVTRSLRTLDPNSHDLPYSGKPETTSVYWKMIQSLRSEEGPPIATTFVVSGDPAQALNEASRVLRAKTKPRESFQPTESLYVVFFSRLGGLYVGIEEVRKGESRVDIYYRQHRHQTADLTDLLVMIPLEKMAPGSVEVVVKQLPTKNSHPTFDHLPEYADDSLVSGSSKFLVQEE